MHLFMHLFLMSNSHGVICYLLVISEYNNCDAFFKEREHHEVVSPWGKCKVVYGVFMNSWLCLRTRFYITKCTSNIHACSCINQTISVVISHLYSAWSLCIICTVKIFTVYNLMYFKYVERHVICLSKAYSEC